MTFDLANSIEIRTWNKDLIQVEASAETEDRRDSEKFDIQIEKDRSGIRITSNSREIFELDKDDRLIVNGNEDFEFNYTVYVPEGVELEVSSILGKVTSKFLKGDITVEVVTGDIEIKEFEGELRLKSVTGKISLPVKEVSFSAETVMGEIYAHSDPRLQKKNSFIGQEIRLDLEKNPNRLNLKTVTGDIYLK